LASSVIVRAIFHDPTLYPEPDAFKPERFLNADGSLKDDPVWTIGFGHGKRICPGRFFADTTLFIVAASVLSVFKIEKRKGAGEGIEAYPFRGSALRYSHACHRRRGSILSSHCDIFS
jgi:cytochrome P450